MKEKEGAKEGRYGGGKEGYEGEGETTGDQVGGGAPSTKMNENENERKRGGRKKKEGAKRVRRNQGSGKR